jgi:putative membrane protein insertion efficiency factor
MAEIRSRKPENGFSLPTFVACLPIHIYRYSFAFIFGGRCRFTPSCSTYALDAIKLHGPVQGARLAGARLCRCHPWGKHGFDPVPPHVK